MQILPAQLLTDPFCLATMRAETTHPRRATTMTREEFIELQGAAMRLVQK